VEHVILSQINGILQFILSNIRLSQEQTLADRTNPGPSFQL
jgi:hypothetical protein